MDRYALWIFLGFLFFAPCENGWAEQAKEKNTVVYQKKTTIDFSDAQISGEWMKPDGAYVKTGKKTKFGNLIELRTHFRPELIRSLGDL